MMKGKIEQGPVLATLTLNSRNSLATQLSSCVTHFPCFTQELTVVSSFLMATKMCGFFLKSGRFLRNKIFRENYGIYQTILNFFLLRPWNFVNCVSVVFSRISILYSKLNERPLSNVTLN